MLEQLSNIQKLNSNSNENNMLFTNDVNKMFTGINPKDSLDFDYNGEKVLKNYNPGTIMRYKESSRLQNLKTNFEEIN
jgi:hypothetical protein